MTTDLRSAAQVVGLLQGQVTELLGRALEVVESAYACPEWLRYGRTERTNETRTMLLDAVLSQVAEGGPDENDGRSPSLVRAPSACLSRRMAHRGDN